MDVENEKTDALVPHTTSEVATPSLSKACPLPSTIGSECNEKGQERKRKVEEDLEQADAEFDAPSTSMPVGKRQKNTSRVKRREREIMVEEEATCRAPSEASSPEPCSFLHSPTRPRAYDSLRDAPERVFHCKSLYNKIVVSRHIMRRQARQRWLVFQAGGSLHRALSQAELRPSPQRASGAITRPRNVQMQPRRPLLPVSQNNVRQRPQFPRCTLSKTPTVSRFIPPIVPKPGIYNILNNYRPMNIRPYLAFLHSLNPTGTTLQPKDTQYKPLSPSPYLREMNAWLLSLLPRHQPYQLFRTLKSPADHDFSVLARCIRYAASYAQRGSGWMVHPVHVALIVERTDGWGIEVMSAIGGDV